MRRTLAAAFLFTIAIAWMLACGTAQAQRRLNSNRTGSAALQQSARRAANAPASPAAANQMQRPLQSQQAPAQQMADPPVLEEASEEQRRAFVKLIEADWIWSPAHTKDEIPQGACYFRKTFVLADPHFGQVHICSDNQYELYVNNQLVGTGNDWRKMDVHTITPHLVRGTNVIAVKVTNTDPGPAGLVARVLTQQSGGTMESFSTDDTWKTSLRQYQRWTSPALRDDDWVTAQELGPLGGTLPWGDEIVIAHEGARFLTDPEFAIERVIRDEQAGSLIAMEFNDRGEILASQEGGPLLLVRDANRDGSFETVQPFSTDLKNVQGILSLGSRVFAVGEGPQGEGLYRLTDQNRDGKADQIAVLLRFLGGGGEHGPHALRLGPDGMLYVMIGNFARVATDPSPRSPYTNVYEGDLIQPRYEDPQGHAVGVPAPGGTVLRTDTNGSFVEEVAGGFRNPYDFAFNEEGELFTFDADMEWDIGTPWYRPTRVNHVTPGAEFGWRSGWAKWPDYYLDSLPAILDLGLGSPTGVEFYDHVMFPKRMQNTLFVADWAQGQIHAVKLEKNGASYRALTAPFIKGRPLNVTDLCVGPDGALYFSTGGRGTDGGIYRVRWLGQVPASATDLGQGIQQALRQPQFNTDWARARIARVKQSLGDARWGQDLNAVARNTRFTPPERARAIDLLAFFGPAPSTDLLLEMSREREPLVRSKAILQLGIRRDERSQARLTELLADTDARVRRMAAESLVRSGQQAPVEAWLRLLADDDRYVAFAARRGLEHVPGTEWHAQVLSAQTARVFTRGAVAILAADPSRETAQAVLGRAEAIMRGQINEPGQQPGYVGDEDFVSLLRVIELALHRGKIPAGEASSLAEQVAKEYPTTNHAMNRELVRLMAYLQPPSAAHAMAVQIASDIPEAEKLHIAAYAPQIKNGWSTEDKLVLLRFYEQVRDYEGGHSVSAYIENFARDYFTVLTMAERQQVLAAGASFPTSALSVLAKLPEPIDPAILAEIRRLDQSLTDQQGEVYDRLRVGIVAVLAASGEGESLAYLRQLYQTQPARRAPIAMSLTQHPGGENWELLVDSLATLEGTPAREVLAALTKVPTKPSAPDAYRNAILQGLRLRADGGDLAVRLLEHWSGRRVDAGGANLDRQLATWQAWFAQSFPDELPAELPKDTLNSKWSYEELLSYLDSPEGRSGDPQQGWAMFSEAQCIKCHRYGGRGESIGPDLSAVSQRFQKKEILESIIYPSHVISDQYASQIVVAGGRTYLGLAAREGPDTVVVLTTDGEKVRIPAADIEEVRASKQSAMPEGLLNRLSLDQVADLFAMLMQPQGASVAGGNAPVRR